MSGTEKEKIVKADHSKIFDDKVYGSLITPHIAVSVFAAIK